jgi:glycosyltransferase involved in cell wall biosynthesis
MIYIFTSEPFPHGLAATNRIISYAHGFLYHKKDVCVICFRKTEESTKVINNQINGTYKNIPFNYLSDSTIKANHYFSRRMEVAYQNILLILYCLHIKRNSLFIYYSPVNTAAIILRLVSWLKSCTFLKEESEHPSVYKKSNNFLSARFFGLVHYHLFDGVLLMTKSLVYYFENEMRYRKPILHVPMSVDVERFNSNHVLKKKHIVFCGELNDQKDGVNILIRAFADISKSYPDYSLSLFGNAANSQTLNYYINMVDMLKISDKVIFNGQVSNDEIPLYLQEASVLALPRPESVQAQHGFPTKLGEYLASGNPVIVTSVGEIPDYLTDGVNALIAKPGNAESFGNKLREILSDLTLSEQIGINGKTTALKYFNNRIQTGDILNFCKKFKTCAV